MDCCSNNSLTDLCFSYMKPQGRNGKEREVTHTHRLGLFVTALSCGQLSNLLSTSSIFLFPFFTSFYSIFIPTLCLCSLTERIWINVHMIFFLFLEFACEIWHIRWQSVIQRSRPAEKLGHTNTKFSITSRDTKTPAHLSPSLWSRGRSTPVCRCVRWWRGRGCVARTTTAPRTPTPPAFASRRRWRTRPASSVSRTRPAPTCCSWGIRRTFSTPVRTPCCAVISFL